MHGSPPNDGRPALTRGAATPAWLCRSLLLDPAYPPERQVIYLTVAQPKGFITLQRAGELKPEVSKVRGQPYSRSERIPCGKPDTPRLAPRRDWRSANAQFIEENLKILCHIPALSPDEDGVLANAPDTDTGVEIGPDDIGTLSFTSGSTGIPKGARCTMR